VLEVLQPGLLTTVQDGIGRPDLARLGVPRGGAADPDALAVANVLVGNDPAAAALEITMVGPELLVRGPCVIGLAGADLRAVAAPAGGTDRDARALAWGRAHALAVGERLRFGNAEPGRGIRAYLALAGGIDVPEVLGSASTSLPGGFGGLDGRALRSGDILRPRARAVPAGPPPAGLVRRIATPAVVRVTPGPHGSSGLDAFLDATWTVSPTSNRVGLRLVGPPLPAPPGRLVSLPMTWGAIQLPPDGQPIVLLVDGPTVGGYPVVAVVAAIDRSAVGQLGPADEVRFVVVSETEARAAELDRRKTFRG
jgi:antagonist of KipI